MTSSLLIHAPPVGLDLSVSWALIARSSPPHGLIEPFMINSGEPPGQTLFILSLQEAWTRPRAPVPPPEQTREMNFNVLKGFQIN